MRDFNHTVNVLVQAYLNETLEKGHCYACAVGNICAEANGIKIIREQEEDGSIALRSVNGDSSLWSDVFRTPITEQQVMKLYNYNGSSKIQIDSTGYSVEELAKIEFAFETQSGSSKLEEQFNGLMAVVDVLAEIHGIDLTAKEEAKLLFVKI